MGAFLSVIYNALSQVFPPAPKFTEANVGDLKGKVYIVTGASSGIGRELTTLLYSRNATVYLASRSAPATTAVIGAIRNLHPSSSGRLVYLPLDLADLTTVGPAVRQFLSQEDRLDVLFNNAGVLDPPRGSRTKQGYELMLGTNTVAPFLLARLLTPILAKTAALPDTERGSVRVVWVSSSAAESILPTSGIPVEQLNDHRAYGENTMWFQYAVSKAGNYLHAVEYARVFGEKSGIVSVPVNPGNIDTGLWRNKAENGGWKFALMKLLFLQPVWYAGVTVLFAGLGAGITNYRVLDDEWVVPWARVMRVRRKLQTQSRAVSQGGLGTSQRFWNWSEQQIRPYLGDQDLFKTVNWTKASDLKQKLLVAVEEVDEEEPTEKQGLLSVAA